MTNMSSCQNTMINLFDLLMLDRGYIPIHKVLPYVTEMTKEYLTYNNIRSYKSFQMNVLFM